MNKIISALTIFFFAVLQTNAQNFTKKWKEVYQLEQDGKTKSAFEKVTEIQKKARQQKNDKEQVKSFIYSSKFKNTLVEDSDTLFFKEIQEEINQSSEIGKAFLYQYYAINLIEYYNENYDIRFRPKMTDRNSNAISIWDKEKFEFEIQANFEKSYANKSLLSALKVVDFTEIITQVDHYFTDNNKTLYQFFIENEINESKDIENYEDDTLLSFNKNYFSDVETFINLDLNLIKDKRIKHFVKLYQLLEKTTFEKPSIFTLNRIKYFAENCENSMEKTNEMEKCKSYFKDSKLSLQMAFIQAQNLVRSANKITGKDNNSKALSILNQIILDKTNPETYTNAFNLKENITAKSLDVQMKNEVYPNENLRAFINYKNIDSISISYYKINLNAINSFKNDSLVLAHMNNHKATKSYFKTLPKKEDYLNYSTEIILEPFEAGNYLVVIGTPKNNGNYTFSYNILKCNSLDYFNEEKNGIESFHFRDRKTGKPLENVFIRTDEKTYSSDERGRFSITQPTYNKGDNSFPIILIHEKDTISTSISYYRGYRYNTTDEDYTAKAQVYFDRAIYRPGQKMFYKGMLIQEKNFKTNVVPFVTVKVEIENANGEIVKTFDVQTNEFGSFSGEFDIPNNGITGRYEITIDEPDTYDKDTLYYNEEEEEHSFWDEVDFDSDYFYFSVEEYKRPTFEVTMDKMTTDWKLGDTIILKGKAIGLAGNTLSDASVKAKTSCTFRDENNVNKNNNQEYLTKTNTDGTFEIQISTKELSTNKGSYYYAHYVDIEVTDINGETRTTKQEVKLSNKLFVLSMILPNSVLKEEKKDIKIVAKTYNNVEKQATGKLNIYKNIVDRNIFNRQFDKPEIEALDSLNFIKLFPHEVYGTNQESKKVLIKTIDFDTKTKNTINLDFLEIGNYIIEAIAFDENNNKIENTRNININSKVPYVPSDKLFSYFITPTENQKEVEVVLKSKIDDLYVTCFEYDEKGNVAFEHIIQLEKGEGLLTLNKPENRLGLYFFAFYEDHFHSDEHTQFYNSESNKLKFEIISLRNKIEPGSTENWQFKILNSKLEAEILASMYDSALDNLSDFNWKEFEREKKNISFPYFSKDYYNKLNFNYEEIDSKKINFYFNNSNNLNWFYNDHKTTSKFSKPKKSNQIIIGTILTKDEIPTEIYVSNLSTNKYTQADFYGNFSIEGKTNDILKINVNNEIYLLNSKNKKNISIHLGKLNSNQKEIALITNYQTYKSKPITISEKKDVVFESFQHFLNILKSDFTPNNKNLTVYDKFMYENYYSVGSDKEMSFGIEQISQEYIVADTSSVGIASDENSSDVIESVVVQAIRAPTITSIENNRNKELLKVLQNLPGSYQNNELADINLVNKNTRPIYLIDGQEFKYEEFLTLNANDLESISVLKGSEAISEYGNRGSNGVIVITTKKAIQELTNVKTRKNFNETAFFKPHIKTDNNGKFVLEFTTPESLTKWSLNILGHNKQAEIGSFRSTIVAQKDLMLIPNMPRFVRENDELVVTAKIANLLNEAKTGIAKLSLFDAGTGNPINALVETKEIQNFNCKAKGSTTVQWKIKIPKDIQGLQYKIVAKAGNFTDGEENILPVLKNAVLITESQSVWLKSKDSKSYTFSALSKTSETKENHKISINLVTNPIWSVIEALPYLMEYEHDCAEQTFSKLVANSISEKIINENPKIKTLLENWKQNPTSKLKINEELKSVLLSETPWLVENNGELQKRISALLDVAKLKTTNEILFQKLKEKQSANGGFSWFGVGHENEYITRHILSGIGHLNQLNPESISKYESIVKKGIAYLESKFETSKTNRIATTDLHGLYTRSFFLKDHPLTKKQDSIVQLQLNDYKKTWLENSLYEKTVLALVLHRFDDKSFAKKIIEHLRESTILDETKGMFWKENTNGYYWHQSNIELQALLIEAFAEIDYKTNEIEAMKVWLINNKQNKNWNTTKSTALAINAIISYGKDWTNSESKIQINDGKNAAIQKELNSKLKETANGLINLEIGKTEITKNLTEIKLENNGIAPVYGGVYYQYFENLDKISATTSSEYTITKELLKDDKLVNTENLKVGDLLTIRLTFKTEKDLEFVHIKDLRASCFEPVNVISETKWMNNTYYYMSTKDVASHFFFDTLPKGTYVLEYKVRINNEGTFSDGYANFQSMYAPEFSAHSKSGTIKTSK